MTTLSKANYARNKWSNDIDYSPSILASFYGLSLHKCDLNSAFCIENVHGNIEPEPELMYSAGSIST